MTTVARGVTAIDTGMAGQRELNSVYLFAGSEPCLIEAGPETDGPVVVAALTRLGVGPDDLAHIVVTHVHIDHAGGAGILLGRFPRAVVWVHERGAPHLADPARLLASTARTYGTDRLRSLYGGMTPCPTDRVRAVQDGDTIRMGERTLYVVHTPGHASHHVALHDDLTGAVCTGEAIGSYLPWADIFRPALPPPEVDVELALGSIGALRARRPQILLTSHFGPVPEPEVAFERAERSVRAWSETVRDQLVVDPESDDDALAARLTQAARREMSEVGIDLDDVRSRYDALGSIRMNAQGLARYWRKRWERDAQET